MLNDATSSASALDPRCGEKLQILESLVSQRVFVETTDETTVEVPLQMLRFQCGDQAVDEPFCRSGGQVLSLTATGMYYWQIADQDRGPLPLSKRQIDGLFGFMTQIVWPRIVTGHSFTRLMQIGVSSPECEPLLNTYSQLKEKVQELARSDIRSYLAGKNQGSHSKVYEAIVSRDWNLLHRYERDGTFDAVAIRPADARFAIPMIESEVKVTSDSGAAALTAMLLTPLLKEDCMEGRYGGIRFSQNRKAAETELERCAKDLAVTAKKFCAEQFIKVARCTTLVEQEQTLFGAYRLTLSGTGDYLARIDSWYLEKCNFQ